MRWLLLLLIACGEKPSPPAAKPVLGLAVEVRGPPALVTGTRRFALRTAGWHVRESKTLVDKVELAAAVAQTEAELGGVVDVFLGTTPLVVGGDDHHEQHVKITPAPKQVTLDGRATKVVTVEGLTDAWRYEHELRTHIAFVTGLLVELPPYVQRIGPASPEASPVSKRLCEHPKIVDLAASPSHTYALVTECSDDAPIRVVQYTGKHPDERRLPSSKELREFHPEAIAVSRTDRVVLAGVRDSQLALYRVEQGADVTTHLDVSRVVAVVVDDSDRVWTLALDAKGYVLARDGERIALASPSGVALEPKVLGLDDVWGIVVLASGNRAHWLFAERPPEPSTIYR